MLGKHRLLQWRRNGRIDVRNNFVFDLFSSTDGNFIMDWVF